MNKFDRYSTHNRDLENGKKSEIWAIRKVAKTGNIERKTPVAGDIDYVRYLSMQTVNLN